MKELLHIKRKMHMQDIQQEPHSAPIALGLSAQMAYWRKQLADVPPLALPTDHRRPALQTYRGAREERLLPEAVSAGLMALSRAEQMTLFITLLAAFQVLLARYSGLESHVTVGIMKN
jgi:hypothetical protein